MDIFGIGSTELLLVFLLAIIVLGPTRMVTVAREAGRLLRNLKAYYSTFSDELKSELEVLDELKEIKRDITRH